MMGECGATFGLKQLPRSPLFLGDAAVAVAAAVNAVIAGLLGVQSPAWDGACANPSTTGGV